MHLQPGAVPGFYRYLVVLPPIVILCLSLSDMQNLPLLAGIASCILLVIVFRCKQYSFLPVDLLVISIMFYEIYQSSTAICFATGFNYGIQAYVATAAYFILRSTLRYPTIIKVYLYILVCIIAFLSLIGAVSFLLFSRNIALLDFPYLSDVKYLYRPMGNLNNVWSAMLLAFLVIVTQTFYYFRLKKHFLFLGLFALLLIIFGIIVSFSRSAYIAFGFYVGAMSIYILCRKMPGRTKAKILSTGYLCILLLCAPFAPDVLRTGRLMQTQSQQRSFESRLHALPLVGPAIEGHALTGIGSGNYSLGVNKYLYEGNNEGFTNFAPNTVIQLLVEKGLLGTLLWLALGIGIGICLWRNRKALPSFPLICILLLTLGIRELCFPALLNNLAYQLFIISLIVIYINTVTASPGAIFRSIRISSVWLILTIFALFAWTCISAIAIARDKKHNRLFLEAFEKGELDQAEHYILSTQPTIPYLVNRSGFYWQRYKATGNKQYLNIAIGYMENAKNKNPRDFMLRRNHAILLYTRDSTTAAYSDLKTLAAQFPRNSVYQVGVAKRSTDKNEIVDCLEKAILSEPKIMDTKFWQTYGQTSNTLFNSIRNRLSEHILRPPVDPIECARYGKIAFDLGAYQLSKAYLKKAIAQLPNLQKPWYYLSEIAYAEGDSTEGRKCRYRSFVLEMRYKDPQHIPDTTLHASSVSHMIQDASLMNKYHIKFMTWYSSRSTTELLSFDL